MSEEEREDPNRRIVLLDLETTGLNINSETILESAWLVTDSDLNQLTPLRSRFTGFNREKSGRPIAVPGKSDWDYVSSYVREMHAKSGLESEWQAASWWTVLNHVSELDRLIFEDLARSGWDGNSKISIAGAGVSAYDRPMLVANESSLAATSHYRCIDSSVTCETLGVPVPKNLTQVSALAEKFLNSQSDDPFSFISVESDAVRNLLSSPVEHRAAVDVAWSYVTLLGLRTRFARGADVG